MKLRPRPSLRQISLASISGLHKEIEAVGLAFADSLHVAGLGNFSEQARFDFLELHPLHVVPASQNGHFELVAGFRSFQLAMSGGDLRLVPACIHRGLTRERIRDFAATDLVGTPLLLGLGTRPQQQFVRICQQVDRERLSSISPELQSGRGIRRMLGRGL